MVRKFFNVKYRLLKKSAQKVWSKDLVYKGTFQLSSRTPHAYKVSYELTHITFLSFKYLNLSSP